MAYAAQHILVTLRGKQFTTAEDWSFGLRLNVPSAPTQSDADLIAALAKTWITTANSGYSAQTTLTAVKVAPIGTDGKYVPAGIAYESFPTSAVGSYGSAVVHPPQIALAMSLQSAQPRGPVHQTHVFLPGPHFPLESGSSPRIAVGLIGPVLANFRTMLVGISALYVGNVQVMSKKFGLAADVTNLRCGRVFDTVRSRRTSITEDYQSLAV
jgi:hypothetical protein